MLKSRQKSDIFQMLHGGPLTGRIIFHELIDQNPETVAGSAHAQSHPAGRFSFSVAAVNVDAAKLFIICHYQILLLRNAIRVGRTFV